ncbi:MAG TPA: L,D-transpeptidase [Longimicrobium sp.]|jgi:L,D-transpeptidase YbiS|uniref:L,D-transpeptidase n=1 Tax=Longimicrobium sp. TaxID=2029185 RepID=UPI002ED98FA8
MSINPVLRRAGTLALVAASVATAQLDAQSSPRPRTRQEPRPSDTRPSQTRPTTTQRPQAASANPLARVRSAALARGGYAVVVDLDANRLHFAKGRRVLWSAPVGTGTGMRLENGRGEWDFSTPTGTFHVTYKDLEPDWIAPDWYFLENGLRVPGPDSDARRFPRGLGSAAVFIGQGLAIHGTDKPELLGQRVSHGCIRLSNADALRLFHNVQVGTEIIIVGGRNVQPAPAPRPSSSSARRSGPPPRDPFIVELEGEDTYALLERLEDELFAAVAAGGASAKWHQVASVLMLRGAREGDDDALVGLLARVTEIGAGPLREEYATFLADAFNQGPLRTLEAMAGMDRDTRSVVARAIVESSLALYPGDPNSVSAPWPTRRAPRTAVRRAALRAWDALQTAEGAYRERTGLAAR